MAVWNTPITWANGGLTAANLNTVRDNLIWLKAFADLITGATADDEGNTTRIQITRATTALAALSTRVAGDTTDRLLINAEGYLIWGDGAGVADFSLGRLSAKVLYLDDAQLRISRVTPANPAFLIRDDADTQTLFNITGDGIVEFDEQATGPAAPGSNKARLFARDNGAGKTQLVAQFNTGAVQVLATQP